MFKRINDAYQFYDVLTSNYLFTTILGLFLIMLFVLLLHMPGINHKFLAISMIPIGIIAMTIYAFDVFMIHDDEYHYESKKPIVIKDVNYSSKTNTFELSMADNHNKKRIVGHPILHSYFDLDKDANNDIENTEKRAKQIVKGRAYKIVTLPKPYQDDKKPKKEIDETLLISSIHKVTKNTIYVREVSQYV